MVHAGSTGLSGTTVRIPLAGIDLY
ncbi:hypothetical protein LEMLEM_LOCUS15503 [Lemmus lemmus]